MDIIAYDSGSIVTDLGLDNMESANEIEKGCLTRYTLLKVEDVIENQRHADDPSSDIQVELLYQKTSIELPRFNQNYHMKRHSYTYGISGKKIGGIAKYCDGKEPESLHYSAGDGRYCSEPIFIANPEGREEDDGVLLTVVLDGENCSSSLVILDANSMKEIGSARVPNVVPHGFHGNFYPSEKTGLARCDA